MNETKNEHVALFVDFEYLYYSMINVYREEPHIEELIEIAGEYGQIIHAKAFADFASDDKLQIASARLRPYSIEPVSVPREQRQGNVKDYSDFAMLDDIYTTYIEKPEVDTFVLVTGDGHFRDVAARLRFRYKKQVVFVGIEGTINHVFFDIGTVKILNRRTSEETEVDVNDLLNYVKTALGNYPYVTFTSTVNFYGRERSLPMPLVQEALSRLISEGQLEQALVDREGKEIKVLRLPSATSETGPG